MNSFDELNEMIYETGQWTYWLKKVMIYMEDIKYEIKETVGTLSENNKG